MKGAKMSFLYDAWYMAAWSSELQEGLTRRRILDEPIVLYRTEAGAAAALTDRCPHRFAPLSRGRQIGDTLECAYHGLRFDASGACVHNPFSDTLPKGAAVRSWPIVERDGIVWIWTGDIAAADAGAVPDFAPVFEFHSAEPITGLMPMRANYEFGTDNLMDLSHIEFVHTGSFAGAGVIFAGRHEVKQEGERLHSNWWMPDVAAPAHTFGIYDRAMRTDHWLDMRWDAPASMMLEIGATPVGRPREEGVIVRQAHILTPETEGTTHYFWATTRSSDHVTPEGDAMLRSMMAQAFEQEDKPIIEAAYLNLDGQDFWDLKPAFLGIDAGGTRARRILQKLVQEEKNRSDRPSLLLNQV